MATIHISEADAARDLPGLLARVREGAEIVIEKEALPAVVLRVALDPRGRLLSESIALAKKHEEETGEAPVLDPDFAADLEEIIRNRRPRDTSEWD
jgi:antitoxin (DNA-binding transcriptional repressor) of toxin-antitoxin stability system